MESLKLEDYCDNPLMNNEGLCSGDGKGNPWEEKDVGGTKKVGLVIDWLWDTGLRKE